jgi:hypothetical protein
MEKGEKNVNSYMDVWRRERKKLSYMNVSRRERETSTVTWMYGEGREETSTVT